MNGNSTNRGVCSCVCQLSGIKSPCSFSASSSLPAIISFSSPISNIVSAVLLSFSAPFRPITTTGSVSTCPPVGDYINAFKAEEVKGPGLKPPASVLVLSQLPTMMGQSSPRFTITSTEQAVKASSTAGDHFSIQKIDTWYSLEIPISLLYKT